MVGCLVVGSSLGGWLIFKERTADRIEAERLAAHRAELDRHLEQAVRLAAAGDWKAAREDLLRDVMQLTEPTDQYHQKAKRELEALSK